MKIKFYKKDDNINNQFVKYEIKEIDFRSSFILITHKNKFKNKFIYLTRNSILELFFQENTIFIKIVRKNNFYIKIIFKEKKDYIIFENCVKNLFF